MANMIGPNVGMASHILFSDVSRKEELCNAKLQAARLRLVSDERHRAARMVGDLADSFREDVEFLENSYWEFRFKADSCTGSEARRYHDVARATWRQVALARGLFEDALAAYLDASEAAEGSRKAAQRAEERVSDLERSPEDCASEILPEYRELVSTARAAIDRGDTGTYEACLAEARRLQSHARALATRSYDHYQALRRVTQDTFFDG